MIARTFDRVCAVLDELGYLDGDTVTADGQRLSRLYSELDLVAAECIRRKIWDGLNPAELAACVSVLSFESRKQSDDAEPARLPGGPVRDVLTAMSRTWAELDQLERRNGLSFLREPDSGFVWAAYRWVRGAKLEDVLDSVPGLTPGDFVRSVKQLIDLLDQIAAAASYDATRKSSRAKTRPAAAGTAAPPAGPADAAAEPSAAARADAADRRRPAAGPEQTPPTDPGQPTRPEQPPPTPTPALRPAPSSRRPRTRRRPRSPAAASPPPATATSPPPPAPPSTPCAAASSPTPPSPTDSGSSRARSITARHSGLGGRAPVFSLAALTGSRAGLAGRSRAGQSVQAGPRLWSCQDDRTRRDP